jgi:outer membrane protein assembly factor BamA
LLHLWAPALRGSNVDLHASAAYSWYRSQYYDLQLGAIPRRGRHKPRFTTGNDSIYPMSDLYKTAGLRRLNLYGRLRHRVYPRETFYGLGPDTSASQRSDYTLHDTLIEVVSEYRVASGVTISARAGMLRTSLGPGGNDAQADTQTLFDGASAPGLVRQPNYLHASAGVLLDSRDHADNPHRGGALGIAVTRYDESQGREFQFNRLTVDGRRFLGFGPRRRHVLAFRALGSFDQPDAGSRVPFYLQSALGGGHVLRGFRTFRFRDEDLLALSAEYRFELVPRVELAAFYDAGKVFRRLGDLDLNHLATSWGVGLRLKTPSKVRLRADVAHSHEGTRLVLKFAPAF